MFARITEAQRILFVNVYETFEIHAMDRAPHTSKAILLFALKWLHEFDIGTTRIEIDFNYCNFRNATNFGACI